jgi:sialate O-acetylesterase
MIADLWFRAVQHHIHPQVQLSMRTKTTAAMLILLLGSPLFAEVKLPAIFGDHMVLQRDAKVPLWGWADAGEAVTVTAGPVKETATAAADGKWKVTLDGLKASDQPIDVTVAGKNTITLNDVLVGDVWVCSGQSNMEFQLGGGKYGFGGAANSAIEIPAANHSSLRLFIVRKKIAFEPQADCVGSWQVCTPDSAAHFSAVGYFFGRDIMEDQHVPVGMIGSYWGGTPAQSWTSLDALKAVPELAADAQLFEEVNHNLPEKIQAYQTTTLPKWEKAYTAWQDQYGKPYQQAVKKWTTDAQAATAAGKLVPPKPMPDVNPPHKPVSPDANPNLPTVLTNGMIAPILPYAIKGAIWYQGESNAGQSKHYQTLFPAMITDWRNRWGEGDFPFIWVQLANFMQRNPGPTETADGWPGLREAQSMTLKLPNTGQAVIIDIGQANDIHPKDKDDVGNRLALAARHVAYGQDLVFSGPTFEAMTIDGNKARITFKNIGSGLKIAAGPSTQPGVPAVDPGSELKGFTIAGADHKFVQATARIEGDHVIVSSPDVSNPQAVRYGWANNPEVNLYNKEGLPASPFRTDDWANPASDVK